MDIRSLTDRGEPRTGSPRVRTERSYAGGAEAAEQDMADISTSGRIDKYQPFNSPLKVVHIDSGSTRSCPDS